MVTLLPQIVNRTHAVVPRYAQYAEKGDSTVARIKVYALEH